MTDTAERAAKSEDTGYRFLKLRMQGTKKDLKWFRRILERSRKVKLLNISELVMRRYIKQIRDLYDFILIDCSPSLGMITINALAAADSVLIPVNASYLPIKGLTQLIRTIGKVKRQLNSELEFEGILFTMVNERTNYSRDMIQKLKDAYGEHIRIYERSIPMSTKAAECTASGESIFRYDPKGKVAENYMWLTGEVLSNG